MRKGLGYWDSQWRNVQFLVKNILQFIYIFCRYNIVSGVRKIIRIALNMVNLKVFWQMLPDLFSCIPCAENLHEGIMESYHLIHT
jgi:hypothetical protein